MARGNQTSTRKHGANKNRRVTTGKADRNRQEPEAKPIITGPSGQANYAEITAHKMDAFKKGQLHNAAGKRVGRPNQALNIARREARMAGARDVPVEGKAEKTKRAEREKRDVRGAA